MKDFNYRDERFADIQMLDACLAAAERARKQDLALSHDHGVTLTVLGILSSYSTSPCSRILRR